MARLYPTKADLAGGGTRVLWLVESHGQTIGTGDSAEDALLAARAQLERCAEVARRRQLPNRYVNVLVREADLLKVAPPDPEEQP